MKTTLLKRLRRQANKEYYIATTESELVGVRYCIMHKEPLCDRCENTVWGGLESAIKMLNLYRRQFIKNQIEQSRFKKSHK